MLRDERPCQLLTGPYLANAFQMLEKLFTQPCRDILLAIADGFFLVASHTGSFGEPFVFSVIEGLIERRRLHPGYLKRRGKFIRYLH